MNRTTAARRARKIRKGRRAAPASAEARALTRLVLCAAIFVLLVAVKLLFPQQVTALARSAGTLIGRDADFQAAFSAVGRAISGEEAVSSSLQDAYTAVFSPSEEIPETAPREEAPPIQETGAKPMAHSGSPLPESPDRGEEQAAAEEVREMPAQPPEPTASEETAVDDTATTGAISTVYTMAPLPENASLEQRNLGFAHVSPLVGELSSPFGWREHPIEGGTKFHYGLDLAADTGTDICAFADGEVWATGESSTLGLYIILDHPGGYRTLYAHCSAVTAAGGPVKAGDKIARVGESGRATGPHLHFELQDGGLYLNPIYYVELG